jgi:hypothetical protein
LVEQQQHQNMAVNVDLLVGVIAAVVAFASAVVSLFGQQKNARYQDELMTNRERNDAKTKAGAIVSKYRDPLLHAANSLQSRIYNIVQNNFLGIYCHIASTSHDKQYAIHNTLYVIGEYIGWVEVVRREMRFLDLGDVKQSRKLQEQLNAISSMFATDARSVTMIPWMFRLWRGEQRAIGELMLIERDQGNSRTILDCVGFATFCRKLKNEEFGDWFEGLTHSIDEVATKGDPSVRSEVCVRRLIQLQHLLIDLIDLLDSEKIRVPNDREKIYKLAS